MSKWDKLIEQILKADKNLRFDDLAKALESVGYIGRSPKSGSSHVTFRKSGKPNITIPRGYPINKAYIQLVKDAVTEFESEVD